MNTDMILDMDNFDFSKIMDEGQHSPTPGDSDFESHKDNYGLEGEDAYFDMDDVDIEDLIEDGEEVEGEEDSVEGGEDLDFIKEAVSNMHILPDDFELKFGDMTIAKGELENLVKARDEISTNREYMTSVMSSLTEKEDNITLFYSTAKTENEKQLEQIDAIMRDPSRWEHVGDMKQLANHKAVLLSRQKELDTQRDVATQSLADQKQQAAIVRIQQTAKELGGMSFINDAAAFAQAQGLDANALIHNMSPALVNVILTAKKFTDLQNSRAARVKKAVEPKTVKSVPSRNTKTSPKQSMGARSKQAAYERAMKNGNTSDAFNFLVD